MKCPNCKEKLARSSSGDTAIFECFYCEGIWVPRPCLAELIHAEKTALTLSAIAELAASPQSRATQKACPECEEGTLTASMAAGFEIDICQSCGGIFYDKGELQAFFPNTNRPDAAASAVAGAVGTEAAFWALAAILGSLFS